MRKLDEKYRTPKELLGEDVYDVFYLFDNEEEAVKYVSKNYDIDVNYFKEELHEEDFMREEFGKELYLRGAKVQGTTYVSELMNGNYILWEAY